MTRRIPVPADVSAEAQAVLGGPLNPIARHVPKTTEDWQKIIREIDEEVVTTIIEPTGKHYVDLFTDKGFGTYLRNSLIASLGSAAISVTLGAMAAYALSRATFRAIARHLVESGALDAVDDVYHLTMEEVFGYVDGTGVTDDLRALVALRRREAEERRALTLSSQTQTQSTE